MKKYFIISCILISYIKIYSQNAVLIEANTTFKTYPFSDPNPIPNMGRIYPYFRFDGFTDKAIQKEWKTIILENDFITLTILPEIGGKIWGAYEKSKNFPFIYYNHVVKFRDVAMRGAWTSGGVEINFGDIGHAPTTATPVDYFTRKNADGSASCFLSATDWTSGTRWTVEVNLEKDKAYFTTKLNWYNASPIEQSYYHWMNAGFKAAGNLEFTYPGSNYIGHGGEVGPWKKDSANHELNFYEKNNFGSYKSYHVMGKKSDFFGGYWHDDEMGFGHYSNYSDKLGKKIWVWGLSREGMIWENLLTDTDGQYVELQSGRLFSQAASESVNSPFKFVSFMPYASDTWDELWFPINGIKGATNANASGAINFTKDKLLFCSLQNINKYLKVYEGNKLIFSELLKLKPLEKVEFDFVKKEGISVFLGKIKMYDDKENQPLQRPNTANENFDWQSEYGLFLMGKSLASQRNYIRAKEYFEKTLAKNKHNLPALAELAQINYREGDYEIAFTNLRKALAVNTYDGQANYLWGLVNTKLQKDIDAVDGFSVAALSPTYRSGALLHLAINYSKNKDWLKAKEFAEKCLVEFPQNNDNQNLLLVIYRNLEKNTEKNITELLGKNPLNHFARAEKYLLDSDKNSFNKLINSELPYYTYLEIANWYNEIDQKADALKILDLSPDFAMVNYWKAFLKNDLKLPFASELEKAIEAPIEFVFPYKNEDIEILQWAEKQQTNVKNSYYLGLLFWKNNKIAEARKLFESCENFENITFLLAKAELFKDSKIIREQSLRKAYDLDPFNWRAIKGLSDYFEENEAYSEALTIVEKSIKIKDDNFLLGQIYGKLLAYNQQFSKSISYMTKLNILPNEGASQTRGMFREFNILEAIEQVKKKKKKEAIKYLNQAETYPENLGSGMPYNPNNELSIKMKKAIVANIKLTENSNQLEKYPFKTTNFYERENLLWELFVFNFNKNF